RCPAPRGDSIAASASAARSFSAWSPASRRQTYQASRRCSRIATARIKRTAEARQAPAAATTIPRLRAMPLSSGALRGAATFFQLSDPRAHPRFEQVERQRPLAEEAVVEGREIEGPPEFLLRA